LAQEDKQPFIPSQPAWRASVSYSKFAPYEHQQIRLYVWFLCNEEPTRKLQNYVEELSDIGYNCSKEFVRAIFKEWRWSWKKPSNKQLQKYTQENLKRYADYVEWISEQDLRKLKFADEVHFVSNSVSRRRVLGPIGDNVIVLQGEHFDARASVTCLTSLTGNNTYCNYRTDTNTSEDFLDFVVQAVDAGALTEGDKLIVDNCSVHCSEETLELLVLFLQGVGVDYVLLPAYSPEFNPCELVFAQTKRYLREHRSRTLPLIDDVAFAFALVTSENMKKI